MPEPKTIYVVLYSPDGIPQTPDGDWAGIIGAFDTKQKAEDVATLARYGGKWGDFSHTEKAHPDHDPDNTSSSWGLFIDVEAVVLA